MILWSTVFLVQVVTTDRKSAMIMIVVPSPSPSQLGPPRLNPDGFILVASQGSLFVEGLLGRGC